MLSLHLHRPWIGRRQHVSGRRRLLITGTPGTGKRALGHYLAVERGFVHLDLDRASTRSQLLRSGEDALRTELTALAAESRKLVVTWTFTSEAQLPYVELMQSLGFEWIWTDSDRGAAYDALLAPGAAARAPRFVDSFEPDGRFRALEKVTIELRKRRPIPLPMPARVRVPAVSLTRPAWAGVAAFTVAVAATGGTYIAGAFNDAQPVRVINHAQTGILPLNGVLVPGESLGGVHLGDSAAQVRVLWGRNYDVIGGQPTTWLYMSPNGDPFGAAVSLRGGRVTAVYTLGGIKWRTSSGLRVNEMLPQFNNPGRSTTQHTCLGYGAVSSRSEGHVTSILTQGQVIYGFALTRPSEPVCH